jgi:hypothetical protein
MTPKRYNVMVYLRAYDSVSEARASIRRYFDFYNRRRPHSSLDGGDAFEFSSEASDWALQEIRLKCLDSDVSGRRRLCQSLHATANARSDLFAILDDLGFPVSALRAYSTTRLPVSRLAHAASAQTLPTSVKNAGCS